MHKLLVFLTIVLSGLALLVNARARSGEVDVALVIAVDISASVSPAEYRQQMAGLAHALESDDVRTAIRSGPNRRIAVALMQWSGVSAQYLTLPWTILTTDAEIERTAARLQVMRRAEDGGATSISAAIRQATDLFGDAPKAQRKVIDVSADGISNIGPSLEAARLAALDQGITINGLAVTNEWRELRAYLENNVIVGEDAFVEEARTYADYGDVMVRKLVREILRPGAV